MFLPFTLAVCKVSVHHKTWCFMVYKLGYRTHNLHMWACKAGTFCTCVSLRDNLWMPTDFKFISGFWGLPMRTALNNSSATMVWLWPLPTHIILISKVMVLRMSPLWGSSIHESRALNEMSTLRMQILQRLNPPLPCENAVRSYM